MAFPDALAWERPKLYPHQVAWLSHRHEFPFSSPVPVAVAAVANWEFSAVGPRLRELCVKLMFLHPVDYGRKAEELLWRKVYYEVIQLIKTNKKAGICRPGWAMGGSTVKASCSWRGCGLLAGQDTGRCRSSVMELLHAFVSLWAEEL